MAIQTGENQQGLKKIIDMTRMISLSILLLHFYFSCYQAFNQRHLTSAISDQFLLNISRTGLLSDSLKSKGIALGFLILSTLGVKGRKDEKLTYPVAFLYLLVGTLIYFVSSIVFKLGIRDILFTAVSYMGITGLGYILVLTGAGLLTRIIKDKLNPEVFNRFNETFPQEERLIQNEYSINLPARCQLKGKTRASWINIINPMRGVLVIGSPGSGKSYFVIEHVIRQHIEKGFSMFIYDYKYDDLSKLAYNQFLKHQNKYPAPCSFYVINLDDPSHSHRCNPIDPNAMFDITDAVEAARVIMFGLNRSWLKKQGDFFVESPINFVTAIIWFLRKYKGGIYCTIPHVIELMQLEIDRLFTVLRTEPEIEAYINPFISAFMTNSMEQLEGQIDSAKISLARLSSPILYHALSGNDFTLDINNPKAPKIVCLANNPQKQDVYGPILSLYVTRMTKIINRKNQLKSSLIMDEFTTLTFLGFDTLIATGRSNKISTTLAIQDSSQLKLNYGKEQADIILNICGNVIVGQASGEIAKQVSERLGKTLQDRQTISINSSDTSFSKSKQLEFAVPVSTIATLSSGEFVGVVADEPGQKIELKTFHSMVINDHKVLEMEKGNQSLIPVTKRVPADELLMNFTKVKQDIQDLSEEVYEAILGNPEMMHLVITKP